MPEPYDVQYLGGAGTATIRLSGECDVAAAPAIKAAVLRAFEEGATSILFDLEGVTFLDSAPLGAFLGARRRARERGGQVTLRGPSPSLVRLFHLLELDKIVTIESTAA